MAFPKRIIQPENEYSESNEQRFRRELENYLYEISSKIDGISNGSSTLHSLYSKRESSLLPPLGITTIA